MSTEWQTGEAESETPPIAEIEARLQTSSSAGDESSVARKVSDRDLLGASVKLPKSKVKTDPLCETSTEPEKSTEPSTNLSSGSSDSEILIESSGTSPSFSKSSRYSTESPTSIVDPALGVADFSIEIFGDPGSSLTTRQTSSVFFSPLGSSARAVAKLQNCPDAPSRTVARTSISTVSCPSSVAIFESTSSPSTAPGNESEIFTFFTGMSVKFLTKIRYKILSPRSTSVF